MHHGLGQQVGIAHLCEHLIAPACAGKPAAGAWGEGGGPFCTCQVSTAPRSAPNIIVHVPRHYDSFGMWRSLAGARQSRTGSCWLLMPQLLAFRMPWEAKAWMQRNHTFHAAAVFDGSGHWQLLCSHRFGRTHPYQPGISETVPRWLHLCAKQTSAAWRKKLKDCTKLIRWRLPVGTS